MIRALGLFVGEFIGGVVYRLAVLSLDVVDAVADPVGFIRERLP